MNVVSPADPSSILTAELVRPLHITFTLVYTPSSLVVPSLCTASTRLASENVNFIVQVGPGSRGMWSLSIEGM